MQASTVSAHFKSGLKLSREWPRLTFDHKNDLAAKTGAIVHAMPSNSRQRFYARRGQAMSPKRVRSTGQLTFRTLGVP